MSIVFFSVGEVGQVGEFPRRNKLVSTDSLSAITAAGYLNSRNTSGKQIFPTDIFDVIYSYTPTSGTAATAGFGTGTYAQFTCSFSGGIITLVSSQNIILPTVANTVAVFTDTSGTIQGVTTLPTALTIPQPVIQQPNIVGVINGSSAAAGSVGEVISTSLSSQVFAMSNNTARDMTAINITAGEWLVSGSVGFLVFAATTLVEGWISSTSATAPVGAFINSELPFALAAGTISFNVPTQIFNVSSTTSIYLSGLSTFSGTAVQMTSCTMLAVRIR